GSQNGESIFFEDAFHTCRLALSDFKKSAASLADLGPQTGRNGPVRVQAVTSAIQRQTGLKPSHFRCQPVNGTRRYIGRVDENCGQGAEEFTSPIALDELGALIQPQRLRVVSRNSQCFR